jgi:hypothetical protein
MSNFNLEYKFNDCFTVYSKANNFFTHFLIENTDFTNIYIKKTNKGDKIKINKKIFLRFSDIK